MPILFSYLLKLSCSLAVVYLFYRQVLRPLTFYNANRWYLLGYSLLSFFIPFINIAHLMEQHQLDRSKVVQVIPVLENYTGTTGAVMQQSRGSWFTLWDAGLLLFALGVLVLLVRLVLQYLSLRRLSRKAQLLADDGIKMYQVNKEIIPFSFGNAIFINQHLHSEAELQEIIRHEFVHVRQRHTIDILFTEILCILNWYNPVAWAIRQAVRQNLEFIADHNVLQSGFDKKEYQYLLLKVMGLPQFRITTAFNLSALKKRIIMMNKLKSARSHLVKFLFMLPLLAVLLVAFRNATGKPFINQAITFTISGLVIDAATQAPLAHVSLNEIYSNATTTTDSRGYFSIAVPVERYPLQTDIQFSKEGFQNVNSITSITSRKQESVGTIEVIGMAGNKTARNRSFVRSYALSGDNPTISTSPTYNEVLKKFTEQQGEIFIELHQRDTVPAPPPRIDISIPDTGVLPDDYKDFLARNPDVATIRWSEKNLVIELKSGKKEVYPLNDAKRMAEAEKKWGRLPLAPPPPPPPPMVKPPADPGPVSGVSKAVEKQKVLVQKQAQQVQLNKLAQQQQLGKQVQLQKAVSAEQNVQLKKQLVESQVQQKQEPVAAIKEQKAIEAQKQMLIELKEQQAVQAIEQKAIQEKAQKPQPILKQKPGPQKIKQRY